MDSRRKVVKHDEPVPKRVDAGVIVIVVWLVLGMIVIGGATLWLLMR
jgi:hypothetical protein